MENDRHMEMLKAALPYIPPSNRRSIELIIQANALVHLARNNSSPDIEGCSIDSFTAEPETMLMSIREFCTPSEASMLQVILNFIHADRLFRKYNEFASSHTETLEAAQFNQTSSPISMLFQLINGLGNNNLTFEFLMSQLSPEQRKIFNQFKPFCPPSQNDSTEPLYDK